MPVARSLATRVVVATVVLAALAALTIGSVSCTDPVRDRAIAALGAEDPAVPPGPDHRPGQPCVLCHSSGGPAEDSPFAVGGTIYATDQPGSEGAEGLFVQFVDARGGAPDYAPQTSAAGNFFVAEKDWPQIAFPLRVGLYETERGRPIQVMKSLIGRDGSCSSCHRTNTEDEDRFEARKSIGQIYVTTGGGS